MKKTVIKLPPIDILKETAEQRKERLSHGNCMRTRIVPNKKKYNRNKQKNEDRRSAYL